MSKTRIVILGGGFGGIFTAKFLRKYARDKVEIELINQTNYFVFQPLLPEVAGGAIAAVDAVAPLRLLLRGVKVRLATVRSIDFDAGIVYVAQGTRRRVVSVNYDHLVLALGQVISLDRFPGLSEHAFLMKTLADAYRLRNHVIDCLELADVTTVPQTKKELLSFVVVGAGFSGVETVGEMAEMIDRALQYYPDIRREEVRIYLVEYSNRLLPELPEDLAAYAAEKLKKRGVEIRLGTAIDSATGTSASFADGSLIETRTIVATIGTAPSPLIAALSVPKQWGRIIVDRCLQVPDFKHVWALGDAALVPLTDESGETAVYAPPTAQFALREAKTLAVNIVNRIRDHPLVPFEYQAKGMLASLGARRAVAEVYGIKVSGFLAWILWRSFYLGLLPGMFAKVRVAMNWFLDALLPRSTVQIEQLQPRAGRYLRYRKGDQVFEPGMIADGFYTVISGSFELEIDDAESGNRLVKTIGPGEHFGERVILGEGLRTGSLRALEDSYVFFINRDDFKSFATAFPVLDEYFKAYVERVFSGSKQVHSTQEEKKDS